MRRTVPSPPSDHVVRALPRNDWLATLPDAAREAVDGAADWVVLTAGEALFRQGDMPDGLYRLVSGRLDVLDESGPGRPLRIGGVKPGMWVGEVGVITGDPRRATVRARRDAVLQRIDQSRAQRLLEAVHGLREALTRDAFRRVTAPPRGESTPRVFGLVPATHGAPLRAVARALLHALGRGVRAVSLDDVRHLLDDPAALGRWLDEAESDTPLLLIAEDPASAWAARVRRSADRVLAIARPGARRRAPPPDHDPEDTWLVLVHDHDGPPRHTAGWRDVWPVAHHHHLRLGSAEDASRLARHLTDRAIGIVLGGGAGRGFAHLGVLQAFAEEGVPVDVVVGTSMGAILGVQVASGASIADIQDRMRRVWTDGSAWDWTVPIVSLSRGTVFRRTLERVVPTARIEDLWLPFGCVSTSLRHARGIEHIDGDVREAVYASSALPGMLPPAQVDGDLRVDGAFVDNLPVGLARRLGARRLIAVNVLPAIDPVFNRPRGGRAVRAALRRWAPWSPDRQPLISDIVMRAYFVPTVLQIDAVRGDVDLFLEPPVGAFGYFDTREDTFEAVVRAGYHEALRGLRMLRSRDPHALSPDPLPGERASVR